jgi:DNA-binding response OmpR family regulator
MAKILTIEDDALTAREIVIELQNHVNDVDCVADGREGLNKALCDARRRLVGRYARANARRGKSLIPRNS